MKRQNKMMKSAHWRKPWQFFRNLFGKLRLTFDDGSFPRKTQDALDLTGLPLTAAWSTGETTEVSGKDVSVYGYNKGTARGHQARKPPTPPV